MNHQIIALVYLRQRTVDGKLIVVLTKGTGHIVDMVTGLIFLPITVM